MKAAVLELEVPDGTRVRLDGTDVGVQRRIEFDPFMPGQMASYEVEADFSSGEKTRRTLLLRGGWHVRLRLTPAVSRPEMVLQTGHSGGISMQAFSPDGRQIVTGSTDSTAILWDVATGRPLRTFEGSEMIRCVAFNPDGRHLLIVGGQAFQDAEAVLWDLVTGKRLRAFAVGKGPVTALAFSPDGQMVLTDTLGGNPTLWDAQTGARIRALGEESSRVPGPPGPPLPGFPGRRQGPPNFGPPKSENSVAWARDGRQVVSVGRGNTAVLWDVATGKQVRSFHGGDGVIAAVALSPDGRQVLTGSQAAITGPYPGVPTQEVSHTPTRRAILWDVATGKELHSFTDLAPSIRNLAFSPDGLKVVMTFLEDLPPSLWDARTGKRLVQLRGHTGHVPRAVLSPDGQTVLAAPKGSPVTLWDAETGERIKSIDRRITEVDVVAFSSDAARVLIGGWGASPAVWDTALGKRVLASKDDGLTTSFVSYRGEGLEVQPGRANPLAGIVNEWFTAVNFRGEAPRFLGGLAPGMALAPTAPTLNGVTLAADGKRLLIGSTTRALLFDVATGKQLQAFGGHEKPVGAVALSPDSRRVLTGSSDKTAILWDTETGERLHTLKGHTDAVTCVVFDRAGEKVLTGSADSTVILWDTRKGIPLRSLRGHTSRVGTADFSPDGRHVLTGSGDGTARLWDVATGDELARLISLRGEQDWVVLTPEGLFDGSREGREQVAFRDGDGLNVVPLDRFFRDFYSPGLLAEIGRGERPTPDKPLVVHPAPLVKMLLGSAADKGPRERVTIDVAVTDQGGGVSGPWLTHNGTAVPLRGTLREEGKTRHHRFSVGLVSGRNDIEVRAATADGTRESEPAMLSIPFDGKLPEPELHVLAVGIDRYVEGSGVASLDCCVADAKAIARLFQQRSPGLYRQVHATALLNDQATRAGILEAVKSAASRAKPQDTFVLYVASHGFALGQRFYLLPHDFRMGDAGQTQEQPRPGPSLVALRGYRDASGEREAAVRSRGLAIDELGEALADIPALKRVLIFDTCHSGSVIQLAGKGTNPFAFRGAIERFSRAQGVYSLAATAADELAAETKELGHSILTYALLAGMNAVEGGPLAGKPAVRAGEAVDVLRWFDYARGEVPGLYEKYVGRPQHVELSGGEQPTFALFQTQAR